MAILIGGLALMSTVLVSAIGVVRPSNEKVFVSILQKQPTATPTAKPVPTRTPTALPVIPTTSPVELATPTAPAYRSCSPSNPEWQGSNPNYPFCSHKDLGWVNTNSNYIVRNLGQVGYASAVWDIYGDNIISVEARLEESNQKKECNGGLTGTGAGGFRRKVSPSGGITFSTSALGKGAFKLELYFELRDGRTVGRNEIFICIV